MRYLKNKKTINWVVENGLCTGCGTCMAICPKSAIKMIIDESKGFFFPELSFEECNQCGLCYQVCPGHSVDYKRLNLDIFGKDPKSVLIGNYANCYIGHSANQETRYNAASGGLVTELLVFALENGIIEGALVTKMSESNPLEPEVFIARTKESIISATKSKYCPVPANIGLHEVLKEKGKFAVVGLPCHMQGIRKAEGLINGLKDKIVFHLGLFCIHCPTFLATEFLLKKLKIKKEEVSKINYRGRGWPGEMSIFLKNGTIKSIPYIQGWAISGSVFPVMRCTLCSDYTCEFSDISFGDPWALLPELGKNEKGKSIIISRNREGEELLKSAVSMGSIDLIEADAHKIIQWHKRSLRFKKTDLKARISIFKLFKKKVPDYNYNMELIHISTMSYLRGALGYFKIILSSKRYLWNLLSILLTMRIYVGYCKQKLIRIIKRT